MRRSPVIYDQTYIKKCFDIWYLNGRPQGPNQLKKIIPEVSDGSKRKPSLSVIRRWMVDGAWDAWADDLDAKVYEQTDKELVNKKAQMLREQQEQARQVTMKALDYIRADGFDSSSAAVQAFFRGLETQRQVAGFSDLLEKLDKMTNNDVEREIVALHNRASENDQVVDTEAEDIPEIEDKENEE